MLLCAVRCCALQEVADTKSGAGASSMPATPRVYKAGDRIRLGDGSAGYIAKVDGEGRVGAGWRDVDDVCVSGLDWVRLCAVNESESETE